MKTYAKTPNIVVLTMLAELWCPCWQWCARTPNNVGTCRASWGRVQPIRLWTPCVMRVRGPNDVGKSRKIKGKSLENPLCKRIQHYLKEDQVRYATFAVAKRKPEKKKSGLYGIRTLFDLCDTGAALYQLS